MALMPPMREAVPRGGLFWDRFLADLDFPAHILMADDPAARRGDPYALFNEMEEKDGHLFSVLQTRKNGVLARERAVRPASESKADRDAAAFVSDVLEGIPNFGQALHNILDAIGKGFSVQEIEWTYRPDGRVGIAGLRSCWPGRFIYDERGRLRLLSMPGAARLAAWAGRAGLYDGAPLPESKFVAYSFGAQHGARYGKGLCARAFWYYWFKKNNFKFWAVYNEKYGAPTAVAKYPRGATEEERARLLEVLESLQSDTGVVLPESVALEFLEAGAGEGARSYQALSEFCNDEISKIVLGQTLTSSEGRRSGSLALGRVHNDVRNEYIESDARDLMAVVNGSLVRWIMAYNFPPGTPAPRWSIDTSEDDDLSREIEVDKQLVQLGVPLSGEYFYKRYRRPAPRRGERALSYDDQNLFQYHLRFGVLTINEVRERLGLPPVSWGAARAGEIAGQDSPAGELESGAERAEQRNEREKEDQQ